MDIIVLVKQVPDTESLIEIDADGVSIKKQDIKWVMNPYDEIAVEEALQIREAKGGSVTVVSMGGQKAIETIRTALAMGADKGVHINDPAAEGSDALATAKILATACKQIPFELIIAFPPVFRKRSHRRANVLKIFGVKKIVERLRCRCKKQITTE